MAKKLVKFMCTAFRDGFQSVYGARVFSQDYMPAVQAAKDAGITWFEAGGGALFQSPFFYCNENAFDVMDTFRKTVGPEANLQTLARGINVVCLDSQPRDIINLHAKMFAKHGMTTIRNFDALNDVNNLIDSAKAITSAGLKHQTVITMMELPPECSGAHDAPFYAKTLKAILDAQLPFDSLCFKDASGTSVPSKVYETIKAARALLGKDVHIQFHSHETAGCGLLCYMAALEAGADGVDLSMAPTSGGTCQTDILTMWHALRGKDYDLGINPDKIRHAEAVFKDCMKDYFLPPEASMVEPLIPWSPMPGGALTANTQMLRDNGVMDKYDDCIKAMSEVVRKGGFGTSVTPVSQFYFQQAFNNVMFGPWKKIAEGYGKMVLGYFGRTPVAPDAEIIKIAAEQLKLEPTTANAVDDNDKNPKKGIEAAKKMLTEAGISDLSDENIFIAAACKEKGIAFLLGKATIGVRKDAGKKEESAAAKAAAGEYTVTLNGKDYAIKLDGAKASVNGMSYDVNVKTGISAAAPASAPTAPFAAPAAAPAAPAGAGTSVASPLPGLVIRVTANAGTAVKTGDEILVIEAMKMEVSIKAPCDGTVGAIKVAPGEKIQSGQEVASVC